MSASNKPAAKNSTTTTTSKGKPAPKGKKPAGKIELAVKGGVRLYGGTPGATHSGGMGDAMPHAIGLNGRDGWGNRDGCIHINRAICAALAMSKPGDKVTLAQVQPLSEALAEAAGMEPAGTGTKGRRARDRAANASHVTHLRLRRVLLADDAADCPPGETPAARGELKLTAGGLALAKQHGMYAPLTSAEKAALAKYEARIAAANKAAAKAGK